MALGRVCRAGRRHGPMVLGLPRMRSCIMTTEDAFQATFLILVRRAASIGRREQLANWLYGVAVRTAKEVKRRAARQKARERRLMSRAKVVHADASDADGDDWLCLLDEELNRLPSRYRSAGAGGLRTGRQVASRSSGAAAKSPKARFQRTWLEVESCCVIACFGEG